MVRVLFGEVFGYENNYDDTVHFEDLEDVGPFIFNATEYSSVMGSAIILMETP